VAVFKDQCQRQIELASKPLRIVSTVPSQTELLSGLGLDAQVIGITAYCVHPRHYLKEKTVIGGTKNLQIEKIRSLQPDLIIGNKEENIKEQIEELAQEFPVWLSDINSVEDALAMIEAIGEICQAENKAREIVGSISAKRQLLAHLPKRKTLYFIWKDPYMVAGPNTFISHMMAEAGYENIAPNSEQRYPSLSLKEVKALHADVILLSSEPYDFTSRDTLDFWDGSGEVRIVDGELFSWYGNRMIKAFDTFSKL
jgi:ABC-type Fe3+-hydroxamate transport system substrate-binding protein